jgi:tRNA-uridine 2-sulfurtransferase
MSKKRVAVALSGGVDSSIAACLLQEAGCEVIGITMRLWSDKQTPDKCRTCPSAASIHDAENICRTLDMSFHLIDLEDDFKKHVIDYFCREYAHGRTPNPCIVCNRHIKFGCLLDRALSLGAGYLATGHYARIKHFENSYHLLKGLDPDKDQSYMLYTLGQDRLSRIFFPLGDYTKSQVRELARQRGLPTAGKPSSQDICFIASDYGTFLSQYVDATPGEIVNDHGKVLGRHKGTAFYTVGQRHGLGLATAEPLYVTRIDPDNSRLIVGSREELYHSQLTASEVSWVSGNPPSELMTVTVKIRYRSPDVVAILYPAPGSAEVSFQQPQPAVTPGQAVVFYKDDEVLGGGTIES